MSETIGYTGKQLLSFTLFSHLPFELRREIIQHSLPPRRFIEITSKWSIEPPWDDWEDVNIEEWWAPLYVPNPDILLVSKEFQQEVLVHLRPVRGSAPGCWTVLVNPARDVICFTDGRFFDEVGEYLDEVVQQLGGSVAYVAMPEALLPRKSSSGWGAQDLELGGIGLKELFVVVDEVYWWSHDTQVADVVIVKGVAGFVEDDAVGEEVTSDQNSAVKITRMMGEYFAEFLEKRWLKDGGDEKGTALTAPRVKYGKYILTADDVEDWHSKAEAALNRSRGIEAMNT